MTRKGQKVSPSARENGRKAELQVLSKLGIGVAPCHGGQVGPLHAKDLVKADCNKNLEGQAGGQAGSHTGPHGPTQSKGKQKVCPDNTPEAEVQLEASDGAGIQAKEATKHVNQPLDHIANTKESTNLIANLPSSEFPLLNSKGQRGQSSTEHNVWKHNKPKLFMNVGVGGKLAFSKASRDRKEPFLLKRSKAIPKERVWGYSLIGQFVGSNPGYYAINEVRKSWGVQSRFKEEGGFMFFLFDNAYDRDKVLKEGPYVARGRTLIIKNIPDKFSFNKGSMATIPIWARIHGLPKDYWTAEILGELASKLGNPLFMDPVTENGKRGTYARVLVELNFAEEIIRDFKIAYEDGEVEVCKVLYENEPYYCPACFSFGHALVGCTFNNRESIKTQSKQVESTEIADGTKSKIQPMQRSEVDDGTKDHATVNGDQEAQVESIVTSDEHKVVEEGTVTRVLTLPTEDELTQHTNTNSKVTVNVDNMQAIESEVGNKDAESQSQGTMRTDLINSNGDEAVEADGNGLHGAMHSSDSIHPSKDQPQIASTPKGSGDSMENHGDMHASDIQRSRKKKSKLASSGKTVRSKSVPPDGRKESSRTKDQVVVCLPALLRKWPPKPLKAGTNVEQQQGQYGDQD